ncbi:hypothetical protein [Nocardia seriolae]|uniref:Uncharacterized protein n=1 Tax=Nocardia seriolae TaxID=37332 RepID=A0ABC9Z0G8_9NOCA|nr:hypothetical protein IMZ23_31060 [Nocardia seriolae]QUN19988.1 hypothetical protein KEC46_12125 [Nocardia seriolae]GAM48815.1 hypothetical protein NS07_v2contig00088-0002 [Nocardia seriolae]GAP31040.1 hypothetical protein NSK11_contig00101-0032 [Nocardia seriolae]
MEKPVRTTFSSAVEESAQEYIQRGWTVAETANGICLVTDDELSGIEVTGETAAFVRRYLRANNLTGPVIEIPGAERREIHLVTGLRKAGRAIEALREAGMVVHTDGAGIPLPPSKLSAGAACWGVAPHEARWVPPVVAVAAAVRAAAKGAPQAARIAS